MKLIRVIFGVALAVSLVSVSVLTSPQFSAHAGAAVQLNCAANPHVCGYPDATNTGVPAGTVLRTVPTQVSRGPGWFWDATNKILRITGSNVVISNLRIPGAVFFFSVSNVTLKNDYISTSGAPYSVRLQHTHNVIVANDTVEERATGGYGVADVYGDSTGTQILRNNVYGGQDGMMIGSGLVADNYIHDLNPPVHNDGIWVLSGSSPLTIRHNTIFNRFTQTSTIIADHNTTQSHRTITGNLMAGGGYCIYAGGSNSTYFVVTNNRFSTKYFAQCGYWGPVTGFNARGTGNLWSGNIWDNTGLPVPS